MIARDAQVAGLPKGTSTSSGKMCEAIQSRRRNFARWHAITAKVGDCRVPLATDQAMRGNRIAKRTKMIACRI